MLRNTFSFPTPSTDAAHNRFKAREAKARKEGPSQTHYPSPTNAFFLFLSFFLSFFLSHEHSFRDPLSLSLYLSISFARSYPIQQSLFALNLPLKPRWKGIVCSLLHRDINKRESKELSLLFTTSFSLTTREPPIFIYFISFLFYSFLRRQFKTNYFFRQQRALFPQWTNANNFLLFLIIIIS